MREASSPSDPDGQSAPAGQGSQWASELRDGRVEAWFGLVPRRPPGRRPATAWSSGGTCRHLGRTLGAFRTRLLSRTSAPAAGRSSAWISFEIGSPITWRAPASSFQMSIGSIGKRTLSCGSRYSGKSSRVRTSRRSLICGSATCRQRCSICRRMRTFASEVASADLTENPLLPLGLHSRTGRGARERAADCFARSDRLDDTAIGIHVTRGCFLPPHHASRSATQGARSATRYAGSCYLYLPSVALWCEGQCQPNQRRRPVSRCLRQGAGPRISIGRPPSSRSTAAHRRTRRHLRSGVGRKDR